MNIFNKKLTCNYPRFTAKSHNVTYPPAIEVAKHQVMNYGLEAASLYARIAM